MTLQGKGYFIWRIPVCENGDIQAIANLAQQADYTHILVKVADGTYSYNIDPSGMDLVPPLVQALHARGITVWGWHYLYGDYPADEADKAIQRINQLGLDGYSLDVEGEYKEPGKDVAARVFMSRMRNALPNFPIALCSYRFPTYHPAVPWVEFLEKCNYNMPQVYWEQAHNPGAQLTRCVQEFQAINPFRPIIPVGSAYMRGDWASTPSDVIEFMQTAISLNLDAANFWEWGHTRRYLPNVWNTIRDFPWSTTPSPPDISQQYIDALNTHNPDAVVNLYNTSAVHVNAVRTIQGISNLRIWFQTLFNQLLPNATFSLASHSGNGSTRHFTWTANATTGVILNGSDTIGLYNGLITYHYTYFTITN